MKKHKTLNCYHCNKETVCYLKEEKLKEKVDKYYIEYISKKYICSVCQNEAYDDEAYDYNTNAANNELRKQTELIKIEDIKEILDKYSIGKKPLSLVLGLGEITITRYLEGQNPTKDNSELLKNVKNNPFLYELFLITNKEKITDIAYRKSLSKVKQIELNSSNSKLYQISLYIIKHMQEVSPLPLQKIIYFISGFASQFMESLKIEISPQAWKYGPVYEDIYNSFIYYKKEPIKYEELLIDHEFDFTKEEQDFLNKMILYFGCYSGNVLVEMSHLTTPWIETRKDLSNDMPSNRKINQKSIEEYFKQVCLDYQIQTIDDISKYSEDLFTKSLNIIKSKLEL